MQSRRGWLRRGGEEAFLLSTQDCSHHPREWPSNHGSVAPGLALLCFHPCQHLGDLWPTLSLLFKGEDLWSFVTGKTCHTPFLIVQYEISRHLCNCMRMQGPGPVSHAGAGPGSQRTRLPGAQPWGPDRVLLL